MQSHKEFVLPYLPADISLFKVLLTLTSTRLGPCSTSTLRRPSNSRMTTTTSTIKRQLALEVVSLTMNFRSKAGAKRPKASSRSGLSVGKGRRRETSLENAWTSSSHLQSLRARQCHFPPLFHVCRALSLQTKVWSRDLSQVPHVEWSNTDLRMRQRRPSTSVTESTFECSTKWKSTSVPCTNRCPRK